ncbi:MAG: ABC transporter substrate-binding protein, partial [Myxococcota bacterium]
ARAVAAYATRRLLVSRFAILSPEDPFGRAMAAAFEEEIARRGGRVTKRASYQGIFDLPARVAQLLDRSAAGASVVPWDALFVPDGTFAAKIARGRLRDAGARNFKLLGTGLWNTPETARDASLEGAVFSAAFSESDPRPASRAFASSYRRTFDDAPDAVSAQANDVASLLMALIRTGSGNGPAHLRERLEVTSGIEGAAGALRFEGGRVAQRGAIILTVRGGRIVPVSPGRSGETTRATP